MNEKAILSAEDYLSFKDLWEKMKDYNYEIKDKKRIIEIKNMQMQIINYEIRNIQNDIGSINIEMDKLKNESRDLSSKMSEKYGIDMTQSGAIDPITREWKTERYLQDEAKNFGMSSLEAIEDAKVELEKDKKKEKKKLFG